MYGEFAGEIVIFCIAGLLPRGIDLVTGTVHREDRACTPPILGSKSGFALPHLLDVYIVAKLCQNFCRKPALGKVAPW